MSKSQSTKALSYPPTRKSNSQDILHGILIRDPYRWLEDLDSQETQEWVEAQNRLTFGFLESLPAREKIRTRLTQAWNYERYGAPFKKGGKYFFFKNDGLQNQSVLYTQATLDSEPRILIDPNTFSTDGTISLCVLSVSEDGRYIAYGLSASGSDWETWRIRRIETGEDLADKLEWIKFSSPVWAKDGSGIYYSRYDGETSKREQINRFQKLYFHRLGEAQSQDTLIYDRPDQEEWGFSADLSESGRFLFIMVWKGTDPMNLVFWRDLANPESSVKELVSEFQAKYTPIGDDGKVFWFLTDLSAPRGRVVGIELNQLEHKNWFEIIPEGLDTLEEVSLVGNRFVAGYLHDAHSVVRAYSLEGVSMGEIALPGLGSAGGFSGERHDLETFFTFTGFTFPATVFHLNFSTGAIKVFRQPSLDFEPTAFETHQVFAKSKDGTRVPIFLVYRKGLKIDGTNPLYLYGYGGFSISLTPSFSIGNLPWLELGGILAIANIRGGGEFGEEWHQAGAKANKQNGFDDFICAAEWLIDEKYTQPAKLAIGGGSNGGLLVAACMLQRPELFGAVLPAVGVLDMLRFHLFTIGWAWVSDYGNPDNAEDFHILLKYSPLHNVKANVKYPAIMITTADHDDRVVPSHSFKFAATIQEIQSAMNIADPLRNDSQPCLIRIETKAGHGAGKPTTKLIEEVADKWAFLLKVLSVEYPIPS
jgi:prolyl oligopeptidase